MREKGLGDEGIIQSPPLNAVLPSKGSTTLNGGGFLREKFGTSDAKNEHVYQFSEHVHRSQRLKKVYNQ